MLEHTSDIWHGFKNKSVFITGATGFFGKWLLESFIFINKKLQLNLSVCALSRDPERFLEEFAFYKHETTISFIKGNVQDFIFPEGKYHYIIHAATDADAKLNSDDPLAMLNTITEGTKRVLQFAVTQPVEAVLLTSSGAVYGQQPAEVTHVKEADCWTVDFNNPASAYAEGKRMAELYCSVYNKQYNLPVKIARCFAFVGPYLPLKKHFAIGNFILNGLNGEDISIKGDGRACRSYMYAADLTIWLLNILVSGKSNVPYNVGSDCSVDMKELASTVSMCYNNKIGYKVLNQNLGSQMFNYIPDITKAKEELNLKSLTNLKEAITKTINFYSH